LNKINEYKIIDDYAIIYVKRRNGDIFELLIDLEDLDRVLLKSWHVGWRRDIKAFYGECCDYLGIINGKPKYKTIMMHKFIMNPCKNEMVDHINQKNTLDNRKKNLRIASRKQNLMNRKSKNKNNTSGYRNVCQINGRWVVQLQVNEKNKVLGKFDSVKTAAKFAEKMRQKYYGEFAGNG
jgi:hypothetical protein